MKKFLAGGAIAVAFLSAGLWLWQSAANQEEPIPAPPPPEESATISLPEPSANAPKLRRVNRRGSVIGQPLVSRRVAASPISGAVIGRMQPNGNSIAVASAG